MTTAKILADSINETGSRLTTFEIEIPKYMVAQLNTHRALSRNYESSRAKPFWQVLKQVCEDPYIPERFGKPTKGMQPAGYYEGDDHDEAEWGWLHARGEAVRAVIYAAYHFSNDMDQDGWSRAVLREDGALYDVFHSDKIELDWDWHSKNPPMIAKETLNRILEPYMKVKGVISATDWDNFLEQRTDSAAQDDINDLARKINVLLRDNDPTFVEAGDWHIPLGACVEEAVENIARVSYGNHRTQSKRKFGELYEELQVDGHWSPFEHVAYSGWGAESNFHHTWTQLRERLASGEW